MTKKSLIEQRADKARKALAKWLRKGNLARTKIRLYKKRMKYYEKRLPGAVFTHLVKQMPRIEL